MLDKRKSEVLDKILEVYYKSLNRSGEPIFEAILKKISGSEANKEWYKNQLT